MADDIADTAGPAKPSANMRIDQQREHGLRPPSPAHPGPVAPGHRKCSDAAGVKE
jgi:hypothetical protein